MKLADTADNRHFHSEGILVTCSNNPGPVNNQQFISNVSEMKRNWNNNITPIIVALKCDFFFFKFVIFVYGPLEFETVSVFFHLVNFFFFRKNAAKYETQLFETRQLNSKPKRCHFLFFTSLLLSLVKMLLLLLLMLLVVLSVAVLLTAAEPPVQR